ncbi:MAG: DNA polymerase III subunit alpha, partial [Acidobacteria bacterium]|nr:DNA polymerase III subunit alpha [Acidobacteriota bacterium]
WTAYLKAGWPVEYGAAILAVADKDEKRLTALSSLRDDGIAVTAPDVNVSLSSTSAVNGEVRIGLAEVKGVGAAGASIVAEREANGPFSSLHDLMTRVRTVNPDGVAQKLSVVAMQGLIEAGALDSLGPRLGHALILRAAMATDVRPVEAEWTSVERSTRQRARLGVSLGVHPMASMEDHLRNLPLNDYSGVYEPLDSISSTDGDGVVTGGVVSSWDEKAYSGGRRANFTLESATMTIRCVMWDSTLSGLRRRNQVPRVGDVIRVSGRVSVNTISVADDESGIEETITTKELKVSSAIPVSTDAVAEVRPPAAVIDFAAKYQQLRNVELPKPAKMKPATVSASVVTDGTDSGADTAPDNIITLDDHRSASGFAVISIRPRESGLMGKVIRGESAVRSRNRIISCPQLPEPGKSYLCVTPNGDRIVLLTSGGAYTAGEMDELLQKVGLDSARWKRLSSKSATTGEWFVLGSEADEADISAA